MKNPLLVFAIVVFPFTSFSQDTFSICAYDSVTGQVGSAGATCIQGTTSAVIISDVVPGKGVVHTQASWLQANKNYAHSLMLLGLTPQQIIDSVTLHDAQGNSTIRQYGVVDVTGASAAFTGSACLNYHNHITGPGYSIQGNILLGQQILDSMESRFLNTPGDLACRLMAALQGAKVTGADTRCTNLGISSVSAFIRVANPADTGGAQLYLNISVNTYPTYNEPIDSLQERFVLWGGCSPTNISAASEKQGIIVFPNPAESKLAIGLRSPEACRRCDSMQSPINSVSVYNIWGELSLTVSLKNGKLKSPLEIDVSSLMPGIYFIRIQAASGEIISSKFVKQ